jgi:hypothetical protein
MLKLTLACWLCTRAKERAKKTIAKYNMSGFLDSINKKKLNRQSMLDLEARHEMSLGSSNVFWLLS